MRICVIGDPHGKVEEVKKSPLKDVDLILLTGDLGKADLARARHFENTRRKMRGLPEKKVSNEYREREYMETYNSAVELVKYLSKFAPVYSIFGNADNSNYDIRKKSRKIGKQLPFFVNDLKKINNVNVINNRFVNLNGLRVGGLEYFIDTSWVKEFKPSDYDKRLEEAKKETAKAKRVLNWFGRNPIDVLLCHQPPYGILDKVDFPDAPEEWKGKRAGSKVLLNYIKKYQPRYVFCGHIHEGKGRAKIGNAEIYNLGEAGYKVVELD